MDIIYTAHATATGEGRKGHVASDDGIVDFDLAIPKDMGGPGEATNPEQLFAAGYSACFHSALKRAARRARKSADGSAVTADVELGLDPEDRSRFHLAVELKVTLPNLDRADAEALVTDAHQICPYSNATRGNIDVRLSVI
jgi:lipoyl-dependent peroxiredoxin